MFLDNNNKHFFYVRDENADMLKIRKESFIRLFNEPDFLSKDRTKRFVSKKKENFEVIHHTKVAVNAKIGISDWVIIKNFSGVAQVLEFKQIGGKTIKARRVRESVLEINSIDNEGLGMLLQYYVVRSDGTLNLANVNAINDSNFIPLNCYKIHLPPPDLLGDKKSYNADVFHQISKLVKLSPTKSFSQRFAKTTTSQRKPKSKRKTRSLEDEYDTDNERIALRNIANRKRARL